MSRGVGSASPWSDNSLDVTGDGAVLGLATPGIASNACHFLHTCNVCHGTPLCVPR